MSNKCGECKVCCEVLAVDGLKEKLTKCEYQCKKGCSRYETRPKGCAHFKCAWLTSGWKKEYRPDISGIMIATYKDVTIAHRLRDEIDLEFFDMISKLNKNIKGTDSRVIKQCLQ